MPTFIMRGVGERFSVSSADGCDFVEVQVVRLRRGRVGLLIETPDHLRVRREKVEASVVRGPLYVATDNGQRATDH